MMNRTNQSNKKDCKSSDIKRLAITEYLKIVSYSNILSILHF
jgi:hypothetical protein